VGKILITGVAGFIGTNAAAAFMDDGWHVVGCDNLSRPGCARNLEWLRGKQGTFTFVHVDIRSAQNVMDLVRDHRDVQAVLHLAGQVAVTTSVVDPRTDFEINALGTLNLLESVRVHCPHAMVLFSSTNKVYGQMDDAAVLVRDGRYAYADHAKGIAEDWPLDFHSPYGCSKGSADQYVRDYARIYGLRTVVARQSCVYGRHQFGMEDQGWVAWFVMATLLGRPVTIYGDGMQVRDVLWIDDLVGFYRLAMRSNDAIHGGIFNVGGGPQNTMSLNELIVRLSELSGIELHPKYSDWRPGDQRVFVADIRKAASELGWAPRTGPAEGVRMLWDWAAHNRRLVEAILG
jgi:CDP-paratose 2-epimerase